MNAADTLRQELAASNLFDKEKVIKTVTNGIKNNGGISEIWEYARKSGVSYGSYDIECSNEAGTAIAEYLRGQGFKVRNNYHPISGHWCGYQVSL